MLDHAIGSCELAPDSGQLNSIACTFRRNSCGEKLGEEWNDSASHKLNRSGSQAPIRVG